MNALLLKALALSAFIGSLLATARLNEHPPLETPAPTVQIATETARMYSSATPEPACHDGEYYDLLMPRCRRPQDGTPEPDMTSSPENGEATPDDGLRCRFDLDGVIYWMPCPGGIYPYDPASGLPTPVLPVQPTSAP